MAEDFKDYKPSKEGEQKFTDYDTSVISRDDAEEAEEVSAVSLQVRRCDRVIEVICLTTVCTLWKYTRYGEAW